MNGKAYYNEWDPYCAAWLRNLIAAGSIPAGYVDERSIVDVRADDLSGYAQCHFFAGISGWPLALRLAGCPDDAEIWTGSCPCQSLSCAGQRKGHADERHLWPEWFRLIRERSPSIIFGEQVANKDGREWFSAVRLDLETLGYACGAADLCAASVGAPHIRQRLFFVANRGGERLEIKRKQPTRQERASIERSGAAGGTTSDLADAECGGGRARWEPRETLWSDLKYLPCADGKQRPTKPGIQPLAHGVSARVGKLRAAGNAIVPPLAAEFIKSAMEAILITKNAAARAEFEKAEAQ